MTMKLKKNVEFFISINFENFIIQLKFEKTKKKFIKCKEILSIYN